jgi:hypothetical protein
MNKAATSLSLLADNTQSLACFKLHLHIDDEPEIIGRVRIGTDSIFLDV